MSVSRCVQNLDISRKLNSTAVNQRASGQLKPLALIFWSKHDNDLDN